jgi:polysaccharide chain length determinant protein (PEP-CTERM system associated)
MGSQIELLLDHVRSAWRYRRLAVVVAWIVFLALVVLICLTPSKYSARAQLYVNNSTVLQPLLQGVAVEADSEKQADIVKRSLLARPTLDSVARAAGLYRNAKTPEAADAVLAQLTKGIAIDGSPQTRMYTISYANRNPATARDVVQAVLDVFIRGSADADSQDATEAETFFRQQVSDYAERLTTAEKRLADFKKRNIGMMPDDRGDYFARLQQEMATLEKSRADLSVARRQQEELRSKIVAGGGPAERTNVPTSEQIQQATAIDGQIAQSRRELDGLLLRYTDRHPQVIALRDTIQRLEQRRMNVAGNVRVTGGSGTGESGGSGDIVVSSLQIALNNADVQVASLETQVHQSEGRVGEMRRLMSVRPEVEAQLTRLNRDYGVTKDRYETLLQRLESAKISHRVDESGNTRFEVLERPRLPLRPVSPPRFLFTLGALIAAIAAGLVAALLMATLRPVFTNRRGVEESLRLPVIGVVALSRSAALVAQEATAMRRLVALVASLVAATVAMGVIAEPLSHLVRKLAGFDA